MVPVPHHFPVQSVAGRIESHRRVYVVGLCPVDVTRAPAHAAQTYRIGCTVVGRGPCCPSLRASGMPFPSSTHSVGHWVEGLVPICSYLSPPLSDIASQWHVQWDAPLMIRCHRHVWAINGGSLKRSARAVQLFGRLAVLENHTLRY